MNNELNKLIESYEEKIKLQDNVILMVTKSIQDCRKEFGAGTNEYYDASASYAKDREIADTKRQAYIQIIQDLKSLEM